MVTSTRRCATRTMPTICFSRRPWSCGRNSTSSTDPSSFFFRWSCGSGPVGGGQLPAQSQSPTAVLQRRVEPAAGRGPGRTGLHDETEERLAEALARCAKRLQLGDQGPAPGVLRRHRAAPTPPGCATTGSIVPECGIIRCGASGEPSSSAFAVRWTSNPSPESGLDDRSAVRQETHSIYSTTTTSTTVSTRFVRGELEATAALRSDGRRAVFARYCRLHTDLYLDARASQASAPGFAAAWSAKGADLPVCPEELSRPGGSAPTFRWHQLRAGWSKEAAMATR